MVVWYGGVVVGLVVVGGSVVGDPVVLVLEVVVDCSVVIAVDTVVETVVGGWVVISSHSSTHIWVSSSNIGLSSGHTG